MKHARRVALLVLLLVPAAGAVAACEPTISADDYDRSCLHNDECMLIHVGPVCSCDCEFSAINSKDGGKYLEDRGELDCDVQCEPCQHAESWCDDRTCAVRTP